MKRLQVWGLGIGIFLAAPTLATFLINGAPKKEDFASSEVVGYLTMLVAMSAIYFALRQYRAQRGGSLSFGEAFKAGTVVNVIAAGIFGLASWLIYAVIAPDFVETYYQQSIVALEQSGATTEAIAKAKAEFEAGRWFYENTFLQGLLMFVTVFLIGLVTTLLSALFLRREAPAVTA